MVFVLLENISYNLKRQEQNIKIFETGKVYLNDTYQVYVYVGKETDEIYDDELFISTRNVLQMGISKSQ